MIHSWSHRSLGPMLWIFWMVASRADLLSTPFTTSPDPVHRSRLPGRVPNSGTSPFHSSMSSWPSVRSCTGSAVAGAR